MKTIENTSGSQFNDWHAFQDSLNWSSYQIQHENIQETFLEAMRCGVQRHKAFDEVANIIRRSGTTVKNDTLHKLWHSARCKWQTRQHSQRNTQPMRIRPTINGQGSCKSVNKHELVEIIKRNGDADVVVDGLNVIYGTPSHQQPSLMNLLGLLIALQKRNLTFKCFFDANTPNLRKIGGFLAAKRLVYAEFLSRLDQGTSKTPTACWRIYLENSPTACWRIGWFKFAATCGGNSLGT